MCEYTKNIQQHPWKINMAPEKWFCYPKIFASLCLMVVLCFDVNTNEDNVKGKDPGTTSWKLCSWKCKVDKLYTFRLIDAQILYMIYNIHTYYHLYVYIYLYVYLHTHILINAHISTVYTCWQLQYMVCSYTCLFLHGLYHYWHLVCLESSYDKCWCLSSSTQNWWGTLYESMRLDASLGGGRLTVVLAEDDLSKFSIDASLIRKCS